MTAFWHPFADMGAVEQHAMEIASGDGVWVTGSDGRRYLDATASLWCCNLGHNRAEINAAIAAQLEQIDSYSCFGRPSGSVNGSQRSRRTRARRSSSAPAAAT